MYKTWRIIKRILDFGQITLGFVISFCVRPDSSGLSVNLLDRQRWSPRLPLVRYTSSKTKHWKILSTINYNSKCWRKRSQPSVRLCAALMETITHTHYWKGRSFLIKRPITLLSNTLMTCSILITQLSMRLYEVFRLTFTPHHVKPRNNNDPRAR